MKFNSQSFVFHHRPLILLNAEEAFVCTASSVCFYTQCHQGLAFGAENEVYGLIFTFDGLLS